MALKFFNIRSGETLTAESEPQIAALWSSSDHSPNVSQGQDMGWRLAPEVAVKLKIIKQDINILKEIALRIQRPLEDVSEPDILGYISAQTTPENAPVATQEDFQDAYDMEIRRLTNPEQFDTTTTTTHEETIEELEARLAAKRAEQGDTTTTTTAPETTTTTTVETTII